MDCVSGHAKTWVKSIRMSYEQCLTYCHSIASSMLSNPSGRAFSRLFMWGRASTAVPNDKWISFFLRRIVQSVYDYPRPRLIRPLQRFGISFQSVEDSCGPQLTLPCYDQRALGKQSTQIHGRTRISRLQEKWDNVMDLEIGFESFRKSRQQEHRSTSRCRSLLLKMSFLEFCQKNL